MGAERRLKTEWANQIEQRPINWLWRPWFARGVITVVEGERGVGKSSLLFDVIARVTAGREFPQFEQDRPGGSSPRDGEAVGAGLPACPIREQDRPGGLSPRDAAPGKVLLLALEDPVDTVVAPRLEAAGADLANVVIVRKTEPAGGHGPAPESELELPRDFDLLAAQCRELRPHLLVIDSLFTALGMDENGRPFQAIDEPGMRRLLAPLKDLAEECQTAVVLVRRVNHAAGAPARQRQSRLAGTAAAQARSVLLLAADPLAPESRVLAMVKSNLAAAPRSVRFEACGAPIRWLGPSDLTADELAGQSEGKTVSAAVASAMYFLKTTLFEPRPYTWAELAELAAKEDIAEITLRRARQELRLIKTPKGQRCYVWSLPPDILEQMHCDARLAGWQ